MFRFDPLYLIFMLPGLALSLWASMRVKSTFKHYSQVGSRSGYSGAEAARELLSRSGIQGVRI
ncbi:MAG TPA: zinc metallopeptidase, partial [Polyangiales bacterium]